MPNKSIIYSTLIAIMLILATGLVYLYYTSGKQAQKPTVANSLQKITKTSGAIEVSAAPVISSNIVFSITLDTHTTELNYDLLKLATLRSDKNEEVKPISWLGDEAGGHHRKGDLIFPNFKNKPASITLTISSIENNTLEFSWKL